MERTIHEKRLLLILDAALNDRKLNTDERLLFQDMKMEDWQTFSVLSHQHKILPLIFEGIRGNMEVNAPEGFIKYLQEVSFQNSMVFYQKLGVLSSLQEKMNALGIFGVVLKGPSLSTLYKVPESRTFNDIDLYFPKEEDYEKLCHALDQEGQKRSPSDVTDYHTSFMYQIGNIYCDTELHYRLSGHFYNGKFDDTLDEVYKKTLSEGTFEKFSVMNQEFSALPVDTVAISLLMHMFQHFMNKGFGLRLLCDWVVFWKEKGDTIVKEKFLSYVKELNLDIFLDTITFICETYLGLPKGIYGYVQKGFSDVSLREDFLQDIFEGGAFGHLDKNRIIVTSRKTSLKGYFLEMHRQMKKNYKKLKDVWILWPVLWVMTTVQFLYNNKTQRKISTIEVFESSDKRNKLARKMQVFDEK